ncbi:unnamed protein product [Moneuplotes crassus]|uniref:Uncharacterized protein n=1 Tax=Euplotes crassus TaxID=5936 RepID=A0AAD1UBK9_EUPCR|nr:unnamed protein product [Moneuplotes crassus]
MKARFKSSQKSDRRAGSIKKNTKAGILKKDSHRSSIRKSYIFKQTRLNSAITKRSHHKTLNVNNSHIRNNLNTDTGTDFHIPDDVKYRFITPKVLDNAYNKEAFNQGYNHLAMIASQRHDKEAKFQNYVSKKLDKKHIKAEENRKMLSEYAQKKLQKQQEKRETVKNRKSTIEQEFRAKHEKLYQKDKSEYEQFYKDKLKKEFENMHNASERHRKSLNTSVSRKRVVQERKFKQRRHEKSLQVTPRSSKKHARTSTVQASTMRPGRSFRETFLESQREFEKRANFERKMNDLQKLREYEYQKRKALNEQKFIGMADTITI